MSERVAVMFDRSLKPEWIDFALEKFIHSTSEESLRAELRAWLKGKGLGEYTVNKTALQLQRTVGYRSSLSRRELEEVYASLRELAPENRDKLRLDVLLRSNEFVRNLFETMKRAALNGADGVTVQQLYERLQADYGHRGMIPRRVRYALQTLVHFGVVDHVGKLWIVK